MPRPALLLSRIFLTLLLAIPLARAQSSESGSDAHETTGRLVLVLPFENKSVQPNLQWIADSFPDTLNQRLNSAAFLTIARDDRQFALDHLGFPADFRPTRATTIRIAQTLDANFVVIGSYDVKDAKIVVNFQILEVDKLRLSPPLTESNDLTALLDVENSVAWKVAHQVDPHFAIARQTFLGASGAIRLPAFENYVRGLSAPTPQERIKRLQAAVAAQPGYIAALLALGKTQYADRQYPEAAATLAKIPQTDRAALEANFFLGLARFNLAKYAEAESAFAFVATRLPLPEVVNNQGVAASRQHRDATALFARASTADPKDPDYHFNLAVADLDRGDSAATVKELDQALKLHPADPEAVDLRTRLTAAKGSGPSLKTTIESDGFEPLPRIRRTYSEASFRQAAFQMDQLRAARLATLPPAEQAAQYSQQGQDYLAQGLIPEAEAEFQAAIAADPRAAAPRTGIAQVRERSGSPDEARKEAAASIAIKPTAAAYLVLARLDLQTGQLSTSAANVANALRIEPANSAALGLKSALQSRGQALP